jgi:hypothetical protein
MCDIEKPKVIKKMELILNDDIENIIYNVKYLGVFLCETRCICNKPIECCAMININGIVLNIGRTCIRKLYKHFHCIINKNKTLNKIIKDIMKDIERLDCKIDDNKNYYKKLYKMYCSLKSKYYESECNKVNTVLLPFGKWKGKIFYKVDVYYLLWLIKNVNELKYNNADLYNNIIEYLKEYKKRFIKLL